MGEDFLRRRNDRFVRQRDAALGRLTERNLFSTVPPTATTAVHGFVLHPVVTGMELWSVQLGADRPIHFYRGAELCVEVTGTAAESLMRAFASSGAELLAEVIELDVLEGIAELQVRSVR